MRQPVSVLTSLRSVLFPSDGLKRPILEEELEEDGIELDSKPTSVDQTVKRKT